MSKDFEEHIKNYKAVDMVENLITYIEHFPPNEFHNENGSFISKRYLKIILKELQRLEAIDNANPSEALKVLNCFLNEMTYCLEHPKEYAKGYEKEIFYKYKYTFETTIKQALTTKSKKELAFEIIKEKKVDVLLLTRCETVYEYNYHKWSEVGELTQEEFDLLKEMVE